MIRLSHASTKNRDMFYAVRVSIPDEFFFLEVDDKKYVFLDYREFDVFRERNENTRIEVVLLNALYDEARGIADDTNFENKMALHILRKFAPDAVEIQVPGYFPLGMADFLRAKGFALDIREVFYPQRLVKEQWEVEAIRSSLAKTHRAFQKIEEMLRESVIKGELTIYKAKPLTSEMLKREAEMVLLEENMLNVEGIIISCREHTAVPHHSGHGYIYANEPIVCDIFPMSRETGYFADMTRTYVRGTPSEKIKAMFDAVLAGQQAAIASVKPGVNASEVHEACSRVLLDRGFHVGDQGFVHATGHGLGLEVHEQPGVTGRSKAVLEPGHVVTIEPGLYYPEFGGVRIEDVVHVTKDGCENLTNYPNQFLL